MNEQTNKGMNEWMNEWMNECIKHDYKGERNIDWECFQRSYENMTDRSKCKLTNGWTDRQTNWHADQRTGQWTGFHLDTQGLHDLGR